MSREVKGSGRKLEGGVSIGGGTLRLGDQEKKSRANLPTLTRGWGFHAGGNFPTHARAPETHASNLHGSPDP
jgi:hypothetical protein